MMRLIILLVIACLWGTATADEQFVCARGELERIISVVYLSDGPLPCEVRYDRGEGAEVLWSAENTQGYCESKAKEFVNKQEEEWGYTCTHYQRASE